MNPRPGRFVLLAVVTAVVAVAVVAGMLVIGKPADERQRRLDEVRLTDLMALRTAIAEHAERTGRLPATLEELARSSPLPVRMTEPVSGRHYGYVALGDSSFRLCATFDFATADDPERFAAKEWAHRAGTQCYRFDLGRRADPAQRGELVPRIEEGADSAP